MAQKSDNSNLRWLEMFFVAVFVFGAYWGGYGERLETKLLGVVFSVWGLVGGQMAVLIVGQGRMETKLDRVIEQLERQSKLAH